MSQHPIKLSDLNREIEPNSEHATMNSEVSTAPTAITRRPMTDQHRKNLSASMKELWARRGGLSVEHRHRISDSVKNTLARQAPLSPI
jgi:hypothetical protein